MDSTAIVALISLIGTLGGSLSGIVVSSSLVTYKPLDALQSFGGKNEIETKGMR